MGDVASFLRSIGDAWDDFTASLHESFDASRRMHNRAATEEQRAKTARSTGMVVERHARLNALPAYVYELADRVRVLDVGANAIDRLDDEVGRLTMATVIRLDGNKIPTLPKSFTSLTNLRALDLRGNALRALPEDIGCLARLEKLDASANALETLPKSLGKCRRLRLLDVSANAFRSTACLEALGRCVELETVDASKNESMRGAIPVSWGCLIKLKEIKIDDTKVDAVPSEVFLSCESLQTLSATRCDALDVKAMKETEGYQHYEARRKGKHDKQLSSRVLMDEARLDERLG